MSGKLMVKKLIDIGANLTDPVFRGIYNSSQKHVDDFEEVLNRAQERGIEKMIITGGTLEESVKALEIAKNRPNLFSTVGCHPTRCNEFLDYKDGAQAYLNQLRDLALNNSSKVVAIGETGLDYDRLHFCPKETQKIYFEKQLSLAKETGLPLFLHNRNSIDDFLDILRRNQDKFSTTGGVVHSFDGTREDVGRILDLGFYIGINGCSLKTDANLEVVKTIPIDKLMIETDCPYCEIKRTHASFNYVKTIFDKNKNATNPKQLVKNRNEPATLIQVLEVLSVLKDQDIEILAEQIYINTNKLFFHK